METGSQLTVTDLIKNELAGKSNAIANYDNMLWKIRSGYAVFVYASVGVITGLVNKKVLSLDLNTSLSLSALLVGFSAFAMILDYSFMGSKLQVVSYRDKLVELAYKIANSTQLTDEEDETLLECLKNSGERKDHIIWTDQAGFWRPPVLYIGTCSVCLISAFILLQSVVVPAG